MHLSRMISLRSFLEPPSMVATDLPAACSGSLAA